VHGIGNTGVRGLDVGKGNGVGLLVGGHRSCVSRLAGHCCVNGAR
jgi:hypothetical protein